MNIASTVLQLDWYFEVEELNISPITKPEKAHEFLRRWPGIYNFAREHSEILALYVPQLTIRGFEEEFDDLLETKDERSDLIFSYGDLEAIYGQKPTCGNVIAFRHPTFGNYTDRTLARIYFHAHDTNYSRSNWICK